LPFVELHEPVAQALPAPVAEPVAQALPAPVVQPVTQPAAQPTIAQLLLNKLDDKIDQLNQRMVKILVDKSDPEPESSENESEPHESSSDDKPTKPRK
jgi:hypothetical protein